MSGFAERLIEELEYLGYSQADLARFLDVRQSTVQTWIQRGSIPAADTALKIARFLGISLEYLIEGTRQEEKAIQLSDFEKNLLYEAKDLTQEDKVELMAYIAMKKSLYRTLKCDNGKMAVIKDC